MGREEEIVREHLKKIEELRKKGINPYPYSFDKKQTILECRKTKLKASVKTAGRLMNKKEFGSLSFGTIRDMTGEIQLVVQSEKTPEKEMEFFKKYADAGDFLGVEGEIIKTKTGEISILIKKLEILSKAIKPLPSQWHGLKDKEERYRKRYLDLIMNPEVKEVFMKREKIIDAIRELLKKKGFMEVDTPYLQSVYGGAEARPFKTHLNALDMDLFLSISPELYLKRLVVGGIDKVFTIARNFRNEGIDKWHNPEFTMMEIYEAYADYNNMMSLFEEIYEYVCKKVFGTTKIKVQGETIDFKKPWKRISMLDSLKQHSKIDAGKMSASELKKIIDKEKIETKGNSWGYYVMALFEHYCEKKIIQPTFITDHPHESTPLCKAKRGDDRLIERFEPFCLGTELGNAYSELNDPEKQKTLLKEQQKSLSGGNEEAHPYDEDFVNSLEYGLPPTGGVGLGIDRMLILLTGQESIRDIILFPFMKPER
jgi:lysyl-tRNA synthetase class 2